MSRQVPLNMKVLSLVTIPNSVQNQPYTVKTPYTIRAELKYHLILHLKGLRYFNTQILLNTSVQLQITNKIEADDHNQFTSSICFDL